jgi:nucleoside-diphosphate-sugar epimerase
MLTFSEHMHQSEKTPFIVGPDEPILVTGAGGFIGRRVVADLLHRGFRRVRCLVRSAGSSSGVEGIAGSARGSSRVEVIKGNLLSRKDCERACRDVAVVFHLAAGTGEASFPDAFMNSVVTTRNLLDACLEQQCLRRFVNVSSFAVYTNTLTSRWRLLDESCPIEERPERRADAYCFAKVKQEQIVTDYGARFGVPHVIVRPGSVYGPGRAGIPGRVGINTFGVFLHLGGRNTIPLTYVDNCAEAIVLAGLTRGVDGETFNVVDDDLPSSSRFLHLYKRNVRRFTSIYVPHVCSYALCWLWERYSSWSDGQLPPVFNRGRWHTQWKATRYSNGKLKSRLGWMPRIPTTEGLRRYFHSCAEASKHA